jgi:predicted nucleic acid-binding protein
MAKRNKKVLIDTGVVIDFLDGVESVRKELFEVIGIQNVHISTIAKFEIYFGMLKKEEKATHEFFKLINHVRLDAEISNIAIGFILAHRREKVKLPDCLIASTAKSLNMELYTFNTKDFDYLEGVKLYKPKNTQKG